MPLDSEKRFRVDRASGLAGLGLSGSGSSSSVRARQSPIDVLNETRSLSGREIIQNFFNLGGVREDVGNFVEDRFGVRRSNSPYQRSSDWSISAATQEMSDNFYQGESGRTRIRDALGIDYGNYKPDLSMLIEMIKADVGGIGRGVNRAGGDDAMTRTPSDFISGKRRENGTAVVESAYDRYKTIFENNLINAQEEATARYRDRITKLEDELAGYKGGLQGVNKAYSEYADDANAILSQAASVDPVPLPDSAVAQEVGDSFEYFSGPIQDALNKVGENGNAELAKEMGAEFRYMEETMVDGIRSKVQSQAELHSLAGAQAQALANMAWKDDAYQSEKARYELELQIKQAMTDKENQIAEVRDAMNTEIDAIRKNAGEFDMAPDELWGVAMNDYLVNAGLDPLEVQNMGKMWEMLYVGDGTVNFSKFKGNLVTALNQSNFARLGILDAWNTFTSILMDSEDPNDAEKLRRMQAIMANPLGPSAAKAAVLEMIKSGVPGAIGDNLKEFDWNTLEDIRDDKYQSILDLWSVRDDFDRNYNDYVTSTRTGYNSTGSQAPNNYANRNQPEYKYRRDVVVPYFASQIGSLFPGTEFGGVDFADKAHTIVTRGKLRNPKDVSAIKAKNSDHLSGGSIDVYYKKGNPAESNAQLRRIAAWAREVPGISLVLFEGKAGHEKKNSILGHVHLSFNVGFRPPGA